MVRVPRGHAGPERRCATARSSRGPGRGCRSACAPCARAARSSVPRPPDAAQEPRPGPLLAFVEAYAAAFRTVRPAARAPPAFRGCCMRARSTRRVLLPFNWFRKKQAADEEQAAAPASPLHSPTPRPVDGPRPPAEAGDRAQQRRRRGSRGGRGRKKHGRGAAPPQAEKKPEKKAPEKEQGRRKPSASRLRRRAGSTPSRRRAQPRRAPPPAREARAHGLGRRRRAARRGARGRRRRRGLPRAARAPLDRREHLQGRRRQRAARHGGRVRRDRPREERLPLRRRDRRPELEGTRRTAADPGPDQPRPGGPRPGGQGPDEDEGRAAHDRDLAPRPLRRLRPVRRGHRRLAPARATTSATASATSSRSSRRRRAA